MPSPAPKAGAAATKSAGLVLGGIAITHPDRVISETAMSPRANWPNTIAGVASLILPQIVSRPLSLLRCPSGIDGRCFFQRNPGRGLGADSSPSIPTQRQEIRISLYRDEKGLLELVQMGAIESIPGAPGRCDRLPGPDDLRSRSGPGRTLRGRQAGRAGSCASV